MPMTDAEKFDRWWAEHYPDIRGVLAGGDEIDVRNIVGAVFMAGAAAERAEQQGRCAHPHTCFAERAEHQTRPEPPAPKVFHRTHNGYESEDGTEGYLLHG